jgi:hypothetical protein
MSVDPSAMMQLIASQLPQELHNSLLLVGSLAAAYHYRSQVAHAVRTKDADIIVQPAGAIDTCQDIATKLLSVGWTRTEKCSAGTPNTPANELRAVRLYPPKTKAYFVELLGLPAPEQDSPLEWARLELDDGWYGLPSFRFMGLLEQHQQRSGVGLRYASPSMMALANALAHPALSRDTMSEPIGGRVIRRCAKDLGRVLAIARLEQREAMEEWPEMWRGALEQRFGAAWRALAARATSGIHALLEDEDVFEQAHHSADVGILSGMSVSLPAFKGVAQQLIQDVLDPLAQLGQTH